MTVRTRFAPSPTGYLHIGGVRTALFNWLLAKQAGGQFILRIDDTDAQRNVAQALKPILGGFDWLGLDWDEGPTRDGSSSSGPHGPYFQSQRGELYQSAAAKLVETGFAYRDYSKPEEFQAQREAAQKEGRQFVYDRTWMAETDEQAAKYEAEGRSFVVRLKMPRDGQCSFTDRVRGDVAFDWDKEQDHVIQRADGSCLYHLANVVDDHEMQITHVVRAEEHLSNTPRQIFIAQSLGYELPEFAHVPYVAEPGGTAKLSKRKLAKYLKNKDFAGLMDLGQKIASEMGLDVDQETFNPVIVDFYEAIGFLPDAMLNYLLLLGWSLDDSSEEFSREDMLKNFSLERVNKSPASFDPQKLTAFQSRYMNALSIEQKLSKCIPFLKEAGLVGEVDDKTLSKLSEIIQAADDRIKMGGDILDFAHFFKSETELAYDEKAFDKRIRNNTQALGLLSKFRTQLAALDKFDANSTQQCLEAFVEAEGIKFNQIQLALRIAVTGKPVGFGMFETLAILGKETCLARIDGALSRCGDEPA